MVMAESASDKVKRLLCHASVHNTSTMMQKITRRNVQKVVTITAHHWHSAT